MKRALLAAALLLAIGSLLCGCGGTEIDYPNLTQKDLPVPVQSTAAQDETGREAQTQPWGHSAEQDGVTLKTALQLACRYAGYDETQAAFSYEGTTTIGQQSCDHYAVYCGEDRFELAIDPAHGAVYADTGSGYRLLRTEQ